MVFNSLIGNSLFHAVPASNKRVPFLFQWPGVAGIIQFNRVDRSEMDDLHNMVIAVMDRDRPGIVAEVTEGISAIGGNLADLSQTVLRGYFTMIMVASFPPGLTAREIEQTLSKGIVSRVIVMEAASLPPESDHSEHVYVLSAIGRNRIGLVAQVSRFCFDRGVNILDLTSHAEDDQYTMMLQIDLSTLENVECFEQDLIGFGHETGLHLALQHNDIFRATNEI
jgi:glycine cleavage system transcriptional repressor